MDEVERKATARARAALFRIGKGVRHMLRSRSGRAFAYCFRPTASRNMTRGSRFFRLRQTLPPSDWAIWVSLGALRSSEVRLPLTADPRTPRIRCLANGRIAA